MSLRPPEAVRRARVVAMLVPDEAAPAAWAEAAGALAGGCRGGLRARLQPALRRARVSRRVPTSCSSRRPVPARVLRQLYERGEGLPAYLAVHQDGSGAAWSRAEAYASAIGCGRARLWRTTVREETEVDLFGEQAVLCGGMNALVTAAFETLAAAGYSPEIAYLECVHQLKYLADLLHERGVAGLREGISSTALYGDVTRGRAGDRRDLARARWSEALARDPQRRLRARTGRRGRRPAGPGARPPGAATRGAGAPASRSGPAASPGASGPLARSPGVRERSTRCPKTD